MAEPKFRKRHRSKVGLLAHVALCSRPDVAFNSVKAARRLNDPMAECEGYVDEALQFLFSAMEDQLVYRCKEPLADTLMMSSDAALADAPGAKSTGGWAAFAGGCAMSWGIGTISWTRCFPRTSSRRR